MPTAKRCSVGPAPTRLAIGAATIGTLTATAIVPGVVAIFPLSLTGTGMALGRDMTQGDVKMRWAARAAWALFIAGGVTPAFSATPLDNGTPDQAAAPPAAAPSIEGVMGKKLISVEGSVIALSASEGRLTREITAPNGTVQRTTFRFISERLGTVMDPRDGSKAAGVFRIGSGDINIQYADGGSETLVVHSEGGISSETKAPQSGSYCTLWYPEGHVFSLEERKLALAQYANRLGLADGDKKTDRNDAQPACTTTSVAEVVKAESKSTAKPDVKTAATN